MNIKELFIFSGRVCGWDEDVTKFVEAKSIDLAEREFKTYLKSISQSGDDSEEIFINFAHCVADYEKELI